MRMGARVSRDKENVLAIVWKHYLHPPAFSVEQGTKLLRIQVYLKGLKK